MRLGGLSLQSLGCGRRAAPHGKPSVLCHSRLHSPINLRNLTLTVKTRDLISMLTTPIFPGVPVLFRDNESLGISSFGT